MIKIDASNFSEAATDFYATTTTVDSNCDHLPQPNKSKNSVRLNEFNMHAASYN